ncbi:sigma-70 family RNA polymerase sigma factor [Candidatus Daviesbacteria bacterium]|nr:sigma-70 family RNA polymerase sigma factor [Candidatus Daviesbacteria bacterium]
MKSSRSDLSLINELLLGNESALRQFYNSYRNRLMLFIKSKIDSIEDVEEITQDTFLDCLDALRNFNGKSSLYTFLISIAKYKIIDYYRKQKIKNIVFSKLPENITPLISQLIGPEEEFDAKEVRSQINIVFAKLKPLYTRILKLKYLEDLSVIEISKSLLVSSKSVESMLFRARLAFVKEYKLLYVK